MAILDISGNPFKKQAKPKILKSCNDRKHAKASKIEGLEINCRCIDVSILASDTSMIEVRLYGQAEFPSDGETVLLIRENGQKLQIGTSGSGTYRKGKELKLDITVPAKLFERINVKSELADVFIGKNVMARNIMVETQFGSVTTNVNFENARITNMSGDIKISAEAKADMEIQVSTISGNVGLNLSNVDNENFKLSVDTVKGEVKKRVRNKQENGMAVTAKIEAMKGDVTVNLN